MMRTIWLGLMVTSIAARAAQLPSSVRFLPGPVNGLLISGKVLVYGDARDRVKAVTFPPPFQLTNFNCTDANVGRQSSIQSW